MGKIYHLGDLQFAIMRVLWAEGEASAAEVHAALFEERRLAPTTIATMLSKMEKKGVVKHRSEGRQYIFRAAVSEEEVRRSMVSELIERVFQGDTRELVNHLIEEREIDGEELSRLKEMLKSQGQGKSRGRDRRGR